MRIGEIHFTGFEDTGVCWYCGADLPKRKRRWCSDACRDKYWETWNWRFASSACLSRNNGACQNCGLTVDELAQQYRQRFQAKFADYRLCSLEVHHIVPIDGEDRTWHKLNEPANLLCLCHACHMEVHRVMNKLNKPPPLDNFEVAVARGQLYFAELKAIQ